MERLEAAAIRIPGLHVQVVERCTSTNEVLFKADAQTYPVLLAAERQTRGRGRRGRRWHSGAGTDITFSLACVLARPLRELPALSLVAGVAAARALRALGVRRAALKWPNDLLVDAAKLGGILVETRSAGQQTLAVIGVGINCQLAPGLARRLRRPLASLDQHIGPTDRNVVIRDIVKALLESIAKFEAGGLAELRREWEALDANAGRRLRVRLAGGRVVSGVSSGLTPEGGLRLATRGGVRAVTSGRIL